jgi:diaminopimelate decarboxylase
MKFLHDWWRIRKEELLALAKEECPLYVYNEETLNDTLFDLLAVDAMEGLFYPVHENPHPRILRKVFELEAGFSCASPAALDSLFTLFPKLESRRILYAPDHGPGKDFERALGYGTHVVMKDLRTLKVRAGNLENRKIFIPIDMDLEEVGLSVEGLYMDPETGVPPLSDTNKIRSFLDEVSIQFPDVTTFILGNGIGVSVNREADMMDIPATGEYLEALKDACPPLTLWLEPGRRMVSHAGALLAKVTGTGEAEETGFLRMHGDMDPAIYDALYRGRHEVVNLSKLDKEGGIPVPIIGKGRDLGNREDCFKGPASIEKGDILLFTNMGAYGPCEHFSGKGRHTVSEHYLVARRICPIKI